jgi:LmbE family N-acetylglucosaminyl deacetylase
MPFSRRPRAPRPEGRSLLAGDFPRAKTQHCPNRLQAGFYLKTGLALALMALGSNGQSARGAELNSGAAIAQELRSFGEMGTVLHVAAHPDDENTQLITYFARGRGYRTAYLSMTRGDGGQNELGRDFGERLGLARTQELLAARRLDGGRQFFTRAIDFGFSKNPEETLRIWNRHEVLGDVVRVIRKFRPDVIITRFPIPPGSGGHGHHTSSAILAVEAFKLAGDPKAYPEQLAQGLTPWQPKRILWNVFNFGRGPGPLNGPTVQLDIGGNDPITGEAFGTIANSSRAMHKTQGLGRFAGREASGPNVQTFMLLDGEPATHDVMDGIDVTWNRVPGGAEIASLVAAASAAFKPDDPAASIPALLEIRARLAPLPHDPLVDDKRAQLDRIIAASLGLSVETTIPSHEALPGSKLALHHTATLRASVPVRWLGVRYPASQTAVEKPIALTADAPATRDTVQTLPADTLLTQPYWLREEPAAGIAHVADPKLIGLPENPPAFPVEFLFDVGGQTLAIPDEPVHLENGARRRLDVIAPVSLRFASEVSLFAPGGTHAVTIEITSAITGAAGNLSLDLPRGWKTAAPGTQPFRLARPGDKQRLTFSVTAPAQTGAAALGAVAKVGGREFRTGRSELRYSHIPPQLLQPPARLRVAAVELSMRAKNVGYLPGAGDAVDECLQQMGCTVTTLTGADLTPEKLHGFDAVVLGVRAFNERQDLPPHLPGLLAYVEQGGTVVMQYNRPNGLQSQALGPYPLSIQGPAPQLRVTDETAPVTFLAPEHPVLNTPNKIGSADFDGWLQERGSYFPSSWDDHYTPIFAMNDPGEKPLKSSLLVAQYGSGRFVYTGLSFFRQLPAGVPGAYRLFANIVSLGK